MHVQKRTIRYYGNPWWSWNPLGNGITIICLANCRALTQTHQRRSEWTVVCNVVSVASKRAHKETNRLFLIEFETEDNVLWSPSFLGGLPAQPCKGNNGAGATPSYSTTPSEPCVRGGRGSFLRKSHQHTAYSETPGEPSHPTVHPSLHDDKRYVAALSNWAELQNWPSARFRTLLSSRVC